MSNDWNQNIIEEFRSNEGRVGGPFESMPILLLHHRGAKSSTERVNPLAYQQLDDGWAIFGSKGGAPGHPDWYFNLLAHPQIRIEVGTEKFDVTARVAKGPERTEIWEQQKATIPQFAGYEQNTQREIPVIVLELSDAVAESEAS